jgi:hypothetical protein
MSTETDETQTQETNTPAPDNITPTPPVDDVDSKIQEALKPIKTKLDSAYKERDEALRKAAEYEQKEKEANIARLQEEGKHKEAFELQLAETQAKLEAVTKRNVELARDAEIKTVLANYALRSDKARDMAYMDIASQLIQNENGVWVHKSGADLRTFVKQFSEHDDNSFLFKAKPSSGGGTTPSGTNNLPDNSPKSIFAMSQEEVLKLAAEGKLRR